MSTCELGKELGCQQKSAWSFKAKLQEAMKSSEQHQLQGYVEIDEFYGWWTILIDSDMAYFLTKEG